jgi:hypothetical protein
MAIPLRQMRQPHAMDKAALTWKEQIFGPSRFIFFAGAIITMRKSDYIGTKAEFNLLRGGG